MSQIFSFRDHPVRTITENGQTWFVGKDIAMLLGYTKTDKEIRRICKHVKLFKGTKLVPLGNSPRGFLIIPESDVWRLIVHSTLPKAQEVEEWVMSEVLPAIRKTGKYEAKFHPLPKPKQKALPPSYSEVDALLGKVRFYIGEIAEAEKRIADIVDENTLPTLKPSPGRDSPAWKHVVNAGCSTRSLWTAIDFALKAVEDSIKVRMVLEGVQEAQS